MSWIINKLIMLHLLGMSLFTVPDDALHPFADNGQTMASVAMRLRMKINSLFYTNEVIKHGVLVTLPRNNKDKAHKQYMSKSLLKVADCSSGVSLLRHVCFERPFRNTKGQTVQHPRGGKIYGSRDRICKFIGYMIHECASKPFLVDSTGVYWDNFNPQPEIETGVETPPMWFHPYIDIDIKNIDDSKTAGDIYSMIHPVIMNVCEFLQTNSNSNNSRTVILMNRRKTGNGVVKWSFHLHWPQYVIQNAADVQGMAMHAKQLCEFVDTGVYSSTSQLFRLPYCGKFGDSNASMQLVRPSRVGDGPWNLCEVKMYTADEYARVINDSCICTRFPNKFIPVTITRVDNSLLLPSAPQTQSDLLIEVADEPGDASNYYAWMNFWRPVLSSYVIPNFIEFRRSRAARLGVNCSFPTIDMIDFSNIRRLRSSSSSFCVMAPGDSFCEYDRGNTPYTHIHVEGTVISYVVDLLKGVIAQFCRHCQRNHEIKWHHFIQTNSLLFPILPDWSADVDSTKFVHDRQSWCPRFFSDYYRDTVAFVMDTSKVVVYDDVSGIWVSGRAGNSICQQKYATMNNQYRDYRVAYNHAAMLAAVNKYITNNPGATDEEIERVKTNQQRLCVKANNQIKELWHLQQLQTRDILSFLATTDHSHKIPTMEPYPHLIPLRDGQCVNLFDWTERKIRPSDYFVSTLNARLLSLHDNDVTEFKEWQLQVCCGDREYLKYKLRVMGVSLTLFNFDRAFYMPLGPIGRNGKSSECTLFNMVTMSTQPARGYNISREYLTRYGQDRKGANAADTVMIDMANKTVLIADECRDTPIDCALVKTLVSGDTTSARNLYESERTNISPRGSLWIVTNKTVKLDYTDTALCNRLRVLPYNAQWVSDPTATRKRMADAFMRSWVFQDDPNFKEHTLTRWNDAMVTATLYELHQFFNSLSRDGVDQSIPQLSRIPVPAIVKKATQDLIHREHPVLAFIEEYMKKIHDPRIESYVPVDIAFANFQRFGKNANSRKMTCMTITQFQEAMAREHIDVATTKDSVPVFKSYCMRREVPNMSNDAAVSVNMRYEPPAVNANLLPQKRSRDDFNEL